MKRTLAILWCIAATAGVHATQGSRNPGATVSGIVRDGASVPVAGAQVTLELAGRTFSAIADANGRFAFTRLGEGDATIEASKPGYLPGYHGQRSSRRPGVVIQLRSGTVVTDADVRVWKYAVISGRVMDADSKHEPLPQVSVEALRWQSDYRGETLVSGGTAVTDDRGEFRFSTLRDGSYILAVRTSPARNRGPQFVFAGRLYPDATTARAAQVITLASGEEFRGADFRLTAQSTSALHGRVADSEGTGRELDLYLLPVDVDALSSGFWLARTRSTTDGRFTFSVVPAGTYVLRGGLNPRPEYVAGHAVVTQMNRGEWATLQLGFGSHPVLPASTAPAFHAETRVTLDGRESQTVALTLQPSARMQGRVEFADGPMPPGHDLVKTAVLMLAIDARVLGSLGAARIEMDGTFRTAGLPPGDYSFNWIGLNGWILQSVHVNERDVTDTGIAHGADPLDRIVITMTARPAEVWGIVRDERGAAARDASVVVFPADRTKWTSRVPAVRRFFELRTQRDGSFSGSGMVEGEYFVVAPKQDLPEYWQTPAILERLVPHATRVTLTNGSRQVLTLKATGIVLR